MDGKCNKSLKKDGSNSAKVVQVGFMAGRRRLEPEDEGWKMGARDVTEEGEVGIK